MVTPSHSQDRLRVLRPLVFKFQVSTVRTKALMIVAGLVYYAAFVACYGLTIVPTHFVEGFTFRELPSWAWTTSVLLAITPLLWMDADFRRPSDFTSWFLYACVTVPSMFVPLMATALEPEDLLPLMLLVLCCQLLFDWSRRGRVVKVTRVIGAIPLFTILLPVLMVILSLALWSHVGFRVNVGIEDVYVRRLEAREALGSGPMGVILRYGQSVLLGAMIPSAVVMGVARRKPHLLAAAAFSVLAVFSFDGQKAVLFGPVMLALVTILASRTRRNGFFWMAGAFILLFVLATLQVVLLSDSTLSTYIVRRVIAMPGLLADYYWEFFSTNEHVMLRDGAIGGIFSRSPYALSTPRLIGAEYFGNPDTNANAGIWLAGFAHFGNAGALVASMLAGWILRLVDSIAVRDKYVAGCTFCMMLGLIWSNGALHTSLMSNGVLILIGVLWLFPASSERLRDGSGRQVEG